MNPHLEGRWQLERWISIVRLLAVPWAIAVVTLFSNDYPSLGYEFVAYLNNLAYQHKGGPVWLIGWGTPTLDAETIYGPLFTDGANLTTYSNNDINGLFPQAQVEMDEKKRRELYQRISKIWIDDAAAAPLYQQLDLYGASKRLNWKARSDEVLQAYSMSLKDGK